MKNLVIIGAGSFGREIFNLAISTREYKKNYIIKGFIDNIPDVLDDYKNYPKIIDTIDNYMPVDNDVFICAFGDPHIKQKYSMVMHDRGGVFINLIHPTVFIGTNTVIGKGCIILNNAHISCDIKIGDFVTIQPFSALGHDVKIGNYCHLNTYAFLGGFAELEDSVTVQTGAIILPQKKVAANSCIGAGSVLVKNVKEACTVFGMPAVKIGF